MKQVAFTSRLSNKSKHLPHLWEHTVGSGHAPPALRADWQRQLRQCHEEPGFRHVHSRDTLSADTGTLMNEQNHLVYSFFNADQICYFITAESSLLIGGSPQLRERIAKRQCFSSSFGFMVKLPAADASPQMGGRLQSHERLRSAQREREQEP